MLSPSNSIDFVLFTTILPTQQFSTCLRHRTQLRLFNSCINVIIIKFPTSPIIIVKECCCLLVYLSGVAVLSALVMYSVDSDFHITVFQARLCGKDMNSKTSLDRQRDNDRFTDSPERRRTWVRTRQSPQQWFGTVNLKITAEIHGEEIMRSAAEGKSAKWSI